MKKTLLLLFSLIAFSLAATAQQQQRGKFNPEEFKAKLESFITQEANLTPAEAQAFFPIYHEMKGKQRGIQHKIFRLKKNAPAEDADETEYAIIIQKINDLGVEMAELGVTYYKALCKAVPPHKVYAAMRAEDKFHRKMLEGFGPGQNRREEGKTR